MTRHLQACISVVGIVLAFGDVEAQEFLRLENGRIGVRFDRETGVLTAIENKLTAETYPVQGDGCEIAAVEFCAAFSDLKLLTLKRRHNEVTARYQGKGLTVEATYTLRDENCFVEKQLTFVGDRKYGLKKVTVSRPTFSASGLRIVPYRFMRECAFFGRTAKGGFFTGMEVSGDASSLTNNEVVLAYPPGLKVGAGEKVTCEPAYFGVYRRGPRDEEKAGLPLRSESDAMVAMTATILGPPRWGLVPMANGWGSQLDNSVYTEASVWNDMKGLDVLAQCGIQWCSDGHPWGGETAYMNALGSNDTYTPSPLVKTFLEHSRKVGVKIVMFSTVSNSNPWWWCVPGGEKTKGRAFCPDPPDWVIDAGAQPPAGVATNSWRRMKEGSLNAGGNCLGSRAFENWLERINLEAIANSPYPGWCVDGDFFGGTGNGTHADCQSDKHDHVPGDSEYACQQALTRVMASIREHYPRTLIETYRPLEDLGVWSLRYVDVCFPLDESGTGIDNLVAGDHIRTWSRTRVHHHFLPHYMDQPLLFPALWEANATKRWPTGHFDYILLSALSSSPNQLFYLPTKTGFPDTDKAEIKKWLDWGRKNVNYLQVRKDLPDWPATNTVDGSAHIVGDRGLVFLFNPSTNTLTGEFALTEGSIGLRATGKFQVSQEYPVADLKITRAFGESVRWRVPPETAAVLRIEPSASANRSWHRLFCRSRYWQALESELARLDWHRPLTNQELCVSK